MHRLRSLLNPLEHSCDDFDPNDYPRLNVQQEWDAIQAAFDPLQQADLVHLFGKDLLSVAVDHDSLRLVVLNSCEGAKASEGDPFSGLAQSLVQRRIPAAIAMQFKITDGAANTFASKFYRAIVEGHPIDTAMGVARRSIYLARNPTEWATPILFMNSDDGQIFQVDRPTEEQIRQRQIEALTQDTRTAIDSKDYATALQKIQKILELQQAALGQPVAGPN